MKNSKRIISVMISLVMVFSAILALAACAPKGPNCDNGHQYNPETGICSVCNGKDPEFHVHEFKETRRKDATCLNDGTVSLRCSCGETKVEVLAALGHNYEEQTSLSRMRKCQNEGCKAVIFPSHETDFADQFVYTMTEDDKTRINGAYDALVLTLEEHGAYDATLHAYVQDSEWATKNADFEAAMELYIDEVEYVVGQYQFAKVQADMDFFNEDKADQALDVSNYYNEVLADYNSLFKLVHDSALREYFFYGMTQEEIDELLADSIAASDPEYVALSDRNDEIEKEYREITGVEGSSKVLDLYEEFVANNNAIAKIKGYDNYMEYAYAEIYGREYTPAQSAIFYDYLKEYVAPLFKTAEKKWEDLQNSASTKQFNDFVAFLQDSFFINGTVNTAVNDFLCTIKQTDAEGATVSYYDHLQDMMEKGNFFRGNYDGAYSWYVEALSTPILFFGDDYQSGNTIVHEFGHYTNELKNFDNPQSYDLSETHSQGLEVLYLSYLNSNRKGILTQTAFDLYASYNTYNNLWIVMLAAGVDRFEQAVYTNSYVGPNDEQIMADGNITKDEYDLLFTSILDELGVSDDYASYWRQVTIQSAGYYISYSISMVCSFQLLAMDGNYDEKVASYLKLVNYTDDEAKIDYNYKQVLENAGLYAYDNEALFIELRASLSALLD